MLLSLAGCLLSVCERVALAGLSSLGDTGLEDRRPGKETHMTKRRTIPALLAAAALGLGATAAWADQPANADMQKQLEALQQQVKDLQAQKATNPAFTARDVDATVD